MVDIFDEVSEDLRAERAQALLRRYGLLIVAAIVLVVAGVCAWQVWRWREAQAASAVASTFLDAMRKSGSASQAAGQTQSQTEATAGFASVATHGPAGYRTLARLREAALRASNNDLPGALALWDQVASDSQADPLLRDVATLSWVQHQVDQGDPSAIESRLAQLAAPGNPWRPLALEEQALLALRTGQDGRARDILKQLQADAQAPDGVRGRASGLLSRLGDAPAPSTDVGG